MKSPSVFAQRRDTRSFVALKPAALLSHCEMNVLVGIFFRKQADLISVKDLLWQVPLLLDEVREFCMECLGRVMVRRGTLPYELDACIVGNCGDGEWSLWGIFTGDAVFGS